MNRIISLLLLCILTVSYGCAHSQTRIACVGNSITYGYGIKDREHQSYPAVLAQLLGNNYNVQNFGVSGRTLLNKGDRPYTKEQTYIDALAFLPDIVIIKLGTNDSKPNNWKHHNDFKKDMISLINSFQSLESKPKIYLCYPTKVQIEKWGITDNIVLNEIIPLIQNIADELHLETIDLHTALEPYPNYFSDGIHPTSDGAEIIARTVYQKITQ